MGNAELIGLVGVGVAVVLGLPTLYWGWRAHRRGVREERDKVAQRQAYEAKRAQAEEREELVRRAQEERQRDPKRARFDVMLGPRDGHGRIRLQVVNRGPHVARDVAVRLFVNGQALQLGQATWLVENGQLIAFAELGRFAGTYAAGTDGDPVVHPAVSGELQISFTDGNGPQETRKRLNIGSGSRFDQRKISITDA